MSTQTNPDVLSIGIVMTSISREAGGLFDAVRQGVQAINGPDYRIAVHGVRDARTEEDAKRWQPIVPNVHNSIGPSGLAIAPSIARAIKASSFDVIHQHGIWQFPSIPVAGFRRKASRAVIISPHGMLDPWALKLSRMKKQIAGALFENANLNGASCIHALNESEHDAIRNFGLTNPVAIIPNGINMPPIQTGSPDSKPDKAEHRSTLLFLGRIHAKKGISETLRAWAHLKTIAPDVAAKWRIVFAGWDDGDHLAGLEAERDALGLAADVSFPGPVFGDEKSALLRQADAFVLASHSEGLPMSILEAWAYELPVFMTQACNLPIGFTNRAAVEISTDPIQMAKALAAHLGQEALASMGKAGHKLVEEHFQWARIGEQFQALYRWVVAPDEVQRPDFVHTLD